MRRTYAAEEKADALAYFIACRGCVKEAARQSGVPRKTLEGWTKGRGAGPEVMRLMSDAKRTLADKLMREADAAVDTLAGKREGASYRDTMIGIGIAVDKAQLLTGGPTAITQEAERQRETVLIAFARLWVLAQERARERGLTLTIEELRAAMCARAPQFGAILTPEVVTPETVGTYLERAKSEDERWGTVLG